MITSKQGELLRFIQRYVAENQGTPPSYIEMQAELGLASKSGVNRGLKQLEERGFIRRIPNRARAIEIIRMP